MVFVVDGREGLVPGDEEIAGALRAVNAPVLMAVNKTDDRRARGRAVEFYKLGFEPVVEMAAEHGEGVGDLLDEIVAALPGSAGGRRPDGAAETETAVAIVGRPNVGKSSLLNRLAEGGAVDRQRHAGDDAGHRGRGAEVAPADVPHPRHRRDPARRAGGAQPGRSSRSA